MLKNEVFGNNTFQNGTKLNWFLVAECMLYGAISGSHKPKGKVKAQCSSCLRLYMNQARGVIKTFMNLENDLKRSLHGSHRLASERGGVGDNDPWVHKDHIEKWTAIAAAQATCRFYQHNIGATLQLKHCSVFCKQIGLLLWGVGQAGNGTLMTSLGWPPADSAGSTYRHSPLTSRVYLWASTIGGHKSVNRQSVNNKANFFINSLIR